VTNSNGLGGIRFPTSPQAAIGCDGPLVRMRYAVAFVLHSQPTLVSRRRRLSSDSFPFYASGVQVFESDFTEPGDDVCLDDVLVSVEGGGLQFAFTVGQPLAL